MGNCTKTSKSKQRPQSLHTYPRKTTVFVKKTNIRGEKLQPVSITFKLTEPSIVKSKQLNFLGERMWVSWCVLPGLDPRGEFMKECQDLCFMIDNADSLFLCLYDGHGSQGERVTQFCKGATKTFFESCSTEEISDPSSFLIDLTHYVDRELKQPSSNINAFNSGCTEVLAYVANSNVFCASVGDSRAVIAARELPSILPNVPACQEKSTLKKKIHEVAPLHNAQLTIDQKPEDPEEYKRIIQAGGNVKRLTDEFGKKVGPYRVWENNKKSPGLAMSRSIGDTCGEKIGIISTPITTQYTMNGSEQFLVLASDGLWDVMPNDEVVTFVQDYRKLCKKGIDKPNKHSIVAAGNTCIAHLLCEEARNRWFEIVEEEDVTIDDISCIILEFNNTKSETELGYVRKNTQSMPEPTAKVQEQDRPVSLAEIDLKDPRRGSVVLDSSPLND